MDSYVRLVTCLIEYGEDWSNGRFYINPKIVTEIQPKLHGRKENGEIEAETKCDSTAMK